MWSYFRLCSISRAAAFSLYVCLCVVKVWDLDKTDVADVQDAPVYDCPVDNMICSTQRRLVFVKTYSKALQYVDSFGIDIWNASSGKNVSFLPFGRYGKLLQMEVC